MLSVNPTHPCPGTPTCTRLSTNPTTVPLRRPHMAGKVVQALWFVDGSGCCLGASGTVSVSVLAQVKHVSTTSWILPPACRRSAGERHHCEAPNSRTAFPGHNHMEEFRRGRTQCTYGVSLRFSDRSVISRCSVSFLSIKLCINSIVTIDGIAPFGLVARDWHHGFLGG